MSQSSLYDTTDDNNNESISVPSLNKFTIPETQSTIENINSQLPLYGITNDNNNESKLVLSLNESVIPETQSTIDNINSQSSICDTNDDIPETQPTTDNKINQTPLYDTIDDNNNESNSVLSLNKFVIPETQSTNDNIISQPPIYDTTEDNTDKETNNSGKAQSSPNKRSSSKDTKKINEKTPYDRRSPKAKSHTFRTSETPKEPSRTQRK